MIKIDNSLITNLLTQAAANPRLRQNFDLRSSEADGSQRMLNALQPGTVVPIHRHPNSNESIVLLCGKAAEIFYDGEGRETERLLMDPAAGSYGCVVPLAYDSGSGAHCHYGGQGWPLWRGRERELPCLE